MELDHLRTTRAAGPARGATELKDLRRISVGTTGMRPVTVMLLATFAACSPATPRCRTGIHEDPFRRERSQEAAACGRGTVDALEGAKLDLFLLECRDEHLCEVGLNLSHGDVLPAAARRKERFVLCRRLE